MKTRKNKALFLDRDGVINVERDYVHRPEEFDFREGIFGLCRAAQTRGYLVVVVTNQAGIARGYYTEAEFLDLTAWMIRNFAREEIQIARVYYCPYHPIHGVGHTSMILQIGSPSPVCCYGRGLISIWISRRACSLETSSQTSTPRGQPGWARGFSSDREPIRRSKCQARGVICRILSTTSGRLSSLAL